MAEGDFGGDAGKLARFKQGLGGGGDYTIGGAPKADPTTEAVNRRKQAVTASPTPESSHFGDYDILEKMQADQRAKDKVEETAAKAKPTPKPFSPESYMK